MNRCNVCFRHCLIQDGMTGFCRARTCIGGKIVCSNYGLITAIALDPIEKKPLMKFRPGSKILSVGSYGCNLSCSFCQNSDISMASQENARVSMYNPEALVSLAMGCRGEGNIGIAFTYNEPLVGYEFVRDTSYIARSKGLETMLVTNGTAQRHVEDELLPFISAMNIDLKAFDNKFYEDVVNGDLGEVLRFIERAVTYGCHVELTTLIIPGLNDSAKSIKAEAGWIAGLSKDIPLHITRFFPRYRMTGRPATDISKVNGLAEVARNYLNYVYVGNT